MPRTAPTTEIRAALDRLVSEPKFRTAAGMHGDAVDAEFRSDTLIADLEELARSDGKARPNVAARQKETFA
ncbi:hypothetical protein [Bradyrhizobium sp. McL0616]|uniref:hypothetical protein n=1 Tax=Bradyrhizobium sp. McL0616 TaxID=3415674 RepID=UPI003CEA90A6